MRHPLSTRVPRAERRAAIGHRPLAFVRHSQSAGTACVRAYLAKPARIPSGDRPRYSVDEGQT
jgi:hypothetical protein